MILRGHSEIETRDKSNDKSLLPLENDGNRVDYHVDEKLLIVRHALNVQVKDEKKVQYDNIFQRKCHIKDKVCNVIINKGSFTNVVGTILVEKLNLPTAKLLRLYKLQ